VVWRVECCRRRPDDGRIYGLHDGHVSHVPAVQKPHSDVHVGASRLAGAERVFEILDELPAIKDRPEARVAPRFSRAIEFHDVSFAYGAAPVLKGVNLVIRAGEMVALVGISAPVKARWRI